MNKLLEAITAPFRRARVAVEPPRAPLVRRPEKIVVLGMMTRHPVAGIVWLTMQYVLGLARLGYDVFYVEAHGGTPKSFMGRDDDGSVAASAFLQRVFAHFDLDGRWAYQAFHSDGACYGLSHEAVNRLCADAAAILNLHGGTFPRAEHVARGRLVYVGTDPVDREIAVHEGDQEIIGLLAAHSILFTWGENYGRPDCKVPASSQLTMIPSRQPIVLDYWDSDGVTPRDRFTTIGSWRQTWRDLTLAGEQYTWSKHHEFLKFLELPRMTAQGLELALGNCGDEDRELLQRHGWEVRDAAALSGDLDVYRTFIKSSRGEFTVAKDQNVRLRSGWFSDRSAAYLAAGRPVVMQDTGFPNTLPTGEGLFAFSTAEEAVDAIARINADYARHSRAARRIAAEYFGHEPVLTAMLKAAGL